MKIGDCVNNCKEAGALHEGARRIGAHKATLCRLVNEFKLIDLKTESKYVSTSTRTDADEAMHVATLMSKGLTENEVGRGHLRHNPLAASELGVHTLELARMQPSQVVRRPVTVKSFSLSAGVGVVAALGFGNPASVTMLDNFGAAGRPGCQPALIGYLEL